MRWRLSFDRLLAPCSPQNAVKRCFGRFREPSRLRCRPCAQLKRAAPPSMTPATMRGVLRDQHYLLPDAGWLARTRGVLLTALDADPKRTRLRPCRKSGGVSAARRPRLAR